MFPSTRPENNADNILFTLLIRLPKVMQAFFSKKNITTAGKFVKSLLQKSQLFRKIKLYFLLFSEYVVQIERVVRTELCQTELSDTLLVSDNFLLTLNDAQSSCDQSRIDIDENRRL